MKFKVRRIDKPWGYERMIALAPSKYAGKIIVVEKGKRLSLQFHRRKHESIHVLKGRLSLRLGRRTVTAGPGASFAIAPGTVHRFQAPYGRVTLIEISTTQLDDVVRLKDDFGRL